MSNSQHNTRFASALAVVLLVFVSLAEAQPPGGRGFRGRGPNIPLLLSSLPEVQEELRLSYEQVRFVEALQRDLTAQFRGRGRSRSPDQPRSEASNEINEKLFATLLNPRQAKRFVELQIQFEGLRALEREDVSARLELTDEQRDRVRELTRQRNEDEQTLETQLQEILTDQQAAKWDELAGEDFRLSDQAQRLRQMIRRFGRPRGRRDQRPEPEE